MQSRFSKTEDHLYQKSGVILHPIIDLQPTNLTCIYSTLLFIQSQADRLNISTPVVTFAYVIGGSGLEEVLTEVCVENSVLHMLSGKAYARAVRAYILVDSVLNNMLIEEVMRSLEPEHIANLKKAFQDFPKRVVLKRIVVKL